MDNLKKQFGEIAKTVREKNKLSQEDMAAKLYLSGKQTIYYYEKGKRVMKLPEFIEFIQTFNETVVIDKNGLSLINNSNNKEIIENKENKKMINQNGSLVMIEEKGDISFYEDKETGRQYQKVSMIGLIPVVDGDIQYQIVESFGNISIRYNLNGVYGYSIWYNEKCYEDNFWSLEQTRKSVDEMFFESQKAKTISAMIFNLENKLNDEGLSLTKLDYRDTGYFLESLDDIFLDGGIFRCENFTDIAIPYALNFGELESNSFEEAIHECVQKVMDYFKMEAKKTVFCKPSLYSGKDIKFEYAKNADSSYCVILQKDNVQLIFTEFYFGCNIPSVEVVLESVKDDYLLFKNSPNLREYINNRGEIDNIESEYDCLKADIQSMINFFGRDYLEQLIKE